MEVECPVLVALNKVDAPHQSLDEEYGRNAFLADATVSHAAIPFPPPQQLSVGSPGHTLALSRIWRPSLRAS